MLPKKDLLELTSFSKYIIKNAGLILLKEQHKANVVKYKDLQDIATSADLKSESYLIENIQNKYPDHSILSEEKGEINNMSDFKWIIDPLDGTKEYLREIPLYNVSLAILYKRKVIISCVYRPSDNNLYHAAIGIGSFLNDKKISVSKTKNIKKALIYCYLPTFYQKKEIYNYSWKLLKNIGKKIYRMRSLSDENSALCWLAHGGIDVYFNTGYPPKIHDILPGLFIAKTAGAQITDIKGNKIQENNIESILVSNNYKIHNEILNIIDEYEK